MELFRPRGISSMEGSLRIMDTLRAFSVIICLPIYGVWQGVARVV